METSVQTIDITPTWRGILPALIELIDRGTDESRYLAIEELTKMANLADKQVALVKANG